jgi:hypothetical protein
MIVAQATTPTVHRE